MSTALAIDVGGTKISAALVDADARCHDRRSVPTPRDEDALVDTIVGLATELLARHGARPVGVSAAAFVDARRRTVLFAPNLAWRDLRLVELLEARLGVPVVLENDGNAAAWGEHRHGAGRGFDELLVVTVGTGVGGGLVRGGTLHRGAAGLGGEVGHLRLVPEGMPCGCGASGCLEAHASGTALLREVREAVAVRGPGTAALLRQAGGVEAIDGPLVSRLAAAGDPFCREALAALGRRLGEGIASLVAVLDPALVVVGGGVAEAGELVLGSLRASLAAHLPGGSWRPQVAVRAAELGPVAGLVGVADLARASA